MRNLSFLLVGLMLGAMPAAAQGIWLPMLISDQDPAGTNLRDRPNGEVIRTIGHGRSDAAIELRRVIVLGQDGAWFRVELADGTRGWMHRSVLGACAASSEDGEARLYRERNGRGGVVQVIADDTPLNLEAIDGEWVEVSLTDGAGRTRSGWVYQQNLMSNPWNDCHAPR